MRKIAFYLTIVSLMFLPFIAKAEGASLYLSPSAGSFFIGSTFNVSVFVNTGGEDVNAVEVNLKFDPEKIQVASPTAGKSFIEIWIAQPTYSNTRGTISFVGGVPSPGINTSAGLVSTLTFRAIAPGKTSIVILENSKVLRNDSKGTNILTSTGRGTYNLLIPPPEGPKIFSPTHPDQNKWYKNNNPTFSWEKEEKVTDFSYLLDQDSTGVPDNVSEGSHTSVSFSNLKDGIWYFHLKAKKENVWGGTSHYLVRIDTTPPAFFTPKVEPSNKTTERQPLVFFITTDALSGLSYYQIKYINITSGKKEEGTAFFVEASSPYRLPSLEIGKYLVVVRAYDKAGNFREGTVEIQILPKGLLINKKGIQFRKIFFPWWLLLLIVILILILISISLWRKHRKIKKERRSDIDRIGEGLEDYRKKIAELKRI